MHPIRYTLVSLACLAAAGQTEALADDLCPQVDALILSGQHIVPFADIAVPGPDELRNETLHSGNALLGLFTQCTLVDQLDDALRPSSTLTCSLVENEGEPVTEASRAGFITGALARLEDISVCLALKDGWATYGDVMEGEFSAYLNDWAEIRPEDAISAELTKSQQGDLPLDPIRLSMTLQTGRDDER